MSFVWSAVEVLVTAARMNLRAAGPHSVSRDAMMDCLLSSGPSSELEDYEDWKSELSR